MLTHKDISTIQHELGVIEGLSFSLEYATYDAVMRCVGNIDEIITREEELLIERGAASE